MYLVLDYIPVRERKEAHGDMMQLIPPLRQLLFRLVLCGLVAVVLVQTGFQIGKYASHQTTLARTTRTHDELHLPAMSFCLGFYRAEFLRHPWMSLKEFQDGDFFPTTRAEAEELWKNVTLDAEEVGLELTHVRPQTGDVKTYDVAKAFLKSSGHRPEECLGLEEHDSTSGKCYTLSYGCPVSSDLFQLRFSDLSSLSQSRLRFHFHDRRDMVGLNENYWFSPVSTTEVFLGEFTEVFLRKRVTKRRTTSSEGAYFRCIQDTMAGWAGRLTNESFCEFPALRSLLKQIEMNGTFSPCPDAARYQATLTDSVQLLFNQVSNSRCPKPSGETTYKTGQKSRMEIMPEHATTVLIYLGSMEVTTEEEYLLLDFPAMLSAIGGFVGMMLGWSAKDLAELASAAT